MPLNNNASVTDQVTHSPTLKTPEIVRGSNEYFYSDHLSVKDNEICSDFTIPNRFECVAKITDSDQLHDDAISLENIDAKPPTPTLDITLPASHKKSMESCLNEQGMTQPPPTGKTPYFNRLCETCYEFSFVNPKTKNKNVIV